MAVPFLLDLLVHMAAANATYTPSQDTHNYRKDRVDLSIGLASKYIETRYLDNEIKDTNVHGIDLAIKFFPFGSEHFFFGFEGQYLTNTSEKRVDMGSIYIPIGFDFDKFGFYYQYGTSEIYGLYENNIGGRDRGYTIYLKYDDISFHIGVSKLYMSELTENSYLDSLDYLGTSYNAYLQYSF